MPAAAETSTCPRCNGSGWIPVPGDTLRVEPCGCQGDLRRRQRLASASIPTRYSHCTLATSKEKSPMLNNAKARVPESGDLWPSAGEGRGLLLIGPCGAGHPH